MKPRSGATPSLRTFPKPERGFTDKPPCNQGCETDRHGRTTKTVPAGSFAPAKVLGSLGIVFGDIGTSPI